MHDVACRREYYGIFCTVKSCIRIFLFVKNVIEIAIKVKL